MATVGAGAVAYHAGIGSKVHQVCFQVKQIEVGFAAGTVYFSISVLSVLSAALLFLCGW
jgi:hypothetical protein